jgi:hypothetical protein
MHYIGYCATYSVINMQQAFETNLQLAPQSMGNILAVCRRLTSGAPGFLRVLLASEARMPRSVEESSAAMPQFAASSLRRIVA